MNVKDLIKLLQEKVKRHEADPEYFNMMGELGVYIDVFGKVDDEKHRFEYKGYSDKIVVHIDPTNGQLLISSFAEEHDAGA